MDQHQHDSSVEAAPVSVRWEESGDLVIMGNVQVLSQNNTGDLTQFQRNKLLFDFNTFFDLNNDGYLSYKVKVKINKFFVKKMSLFRISSGPRTGYVRCQAGRWTVRNTNPRRNCSLTSGPAWSVLLTLTMMERLPGTFIRITSLIAM